MIETEKEKLQLNKEQMHAIAIDDQTKVQPSVQENGLMLEEDALEAITGGGKEKLLDQIKRCFGRGTPRSKSPTPTAQGVTARSSPRRACPLPLPRSFSRDKEIMDKLPPIRTR